jgi:hypothetical protein
MPLNNWILYRAAPGKKKASLQIADVRPGNWRGEIVSGGTLNFGQVVQEGPPRQSVEFTI